MQNTRTLLDKSWQWRLVSTTTEDKKQLPESVDLTQWQEAQYSPSEIHLELLSRKLLPDYNVGQNERKIQWVGRSDWEYRCIFPTPEEAVNSGHRHVELFFEGLDTFATVTLNGKEIAKSDNQFIPFRVDVGKLLAEPGKNDNELVILFESAERVGRELEKKWGERTSLMRDKKRMNMRKAQYSWGWDWGPKILNAGPHLPVYLETYDNRVDNLYVTSALSEKLDSAKLSVQVNLGEAAADFTRLRLDILQNGEVVYSTTTSISAGEKSQPITTDIANPKVWWPHGHGEHPIYTATAIILSQDEKAIDEKQTKFGIRKIEVVQRPLIDAPGKTFMFQVNNKSIFIQGADWIPSDNLAPTMTRERYFAWIRMAQKSNVNMIRVWGGGYYETEDFWDACDEHGIMIWQDYMLACGDYPIHAPFLESIRKEAELQTIRFRNRASLALLCGGNEDFMFADWAGPYDHDDMKGPFEDTSFPQRKIYLDVLLNVAGEFAPHVQYWANSPWGGPTANDETIGDVHQWDVWHGKQLAYQDYHTLSGRFISEFGMHGYPDMRTVNVFCPDPADRHPQSQTIDCHNKGEGAEKRIARYMAENFRYTNDLEIYAYVSQLVQSEAYGYALRDWKRNFKGEGKEYCAGAIIWQLNDCYPCTSWSYIDYYLRPKPAFYTIRRTFAPISVGVARTPRSRFIDDNKPYESTVPPKFEIFAHNTTTEKQDVTLVIKAFDLYTEKFIEYEDASRQVSLLPGQNTELGTLTNPSAVDADSLIILSASLIDCNETVVARIIDWPEPFRYLNWPKGTKVTTMIKTTSGEGDDGWETVDIDSNNPVKGVLLDVESGEMPEWEDNMVDLLPGDKVQVRVKGLEGRKITSRWLNDWEQK